MAVGKVRKFFIHLMVGANIASIIVMFLVGYSGKLNPADHPIFSCMGLFFPIFLLINLLFLLFWAFVRLRLIIIPILGFLVCYQPLSTYLPLHFFQDPPVEGTLKVLSYNVKEFEIGRDDGLPVHKASQYILDSQADIVCLQEVVLGNPYLIPALDAYPWKTDMPGDRSGGLVVLSKYPIMKKERIPYPSQGNLSMAVTIDVDGEKIIVVNNHFQTSGLTIEDKKDFSDMVGGTNRQELHRESKHLLTVLGRSAAKRAGQVDKVAAYVREHQGQPLLLCGDFNETPISYSHETFAKLLTDCYVTSGHGVGWSYNSNRIHVRIDNIFCSHHWQPLKCEIDTKIHASDHYPIICHLKKHDN